ncbi:CPBP family intramembrane metalloprotease [Candidatus Dependentiae bacterium]|nr:MAG: CPBP family intramembrane metalloprotease [Candidatus Dependentiae bacterium]
MNKWRFGLLFVATAIFGYTAWYLFPKAFPIIHIPLNANRTEILGLAKKKALDFGYKPINDNSCFEAVTFESDTVTQTFVELEGGGKKAFTDMIEKHYYEPYYWHVRFFVPHEIHEMALYFTPSGAFYGFKETVSENSFNGNISSQEALTKASIYAKEQCIPLDQYTIIESSQQTTPLGRIDHSFVYERHDIRLNQGSYRLRITISGTNVTECKRFIKIPETFERKYLELRSYNNILSLFGFLLMIFLYIIGICFIALFVYTKAQLFLWKPALVCAGFIGFLSILQQINQLPLLLMHYDTITDIHAFIIKNLLLICSHGLIITVFFTIIIAVAEGLTRKAFPQHIQLWSVWAANCANSSPVFLQTVAGYGLASFDLLLVVVTYLFTTHFFGWWNPSYALADPNILATYVPALHTIALSLQAGFIEECLCRAIPLACTSLLGKYYNKKYFFMVLGFITQAFIFGALHASYPAQPFYARLFELIIPSFIWGIFYLYFGLLPIIICHVIYDTVWFSLPVFISYATNIWIQKGIIIIYAISPLLVIAYRYYKTKQWHSDVSSFLNHTWQAPTVKESFEKSIVSYIPYTHSGKKTYVAYGFSTALIMCIIMWLAKPDATMVNLPCKKEIITIAKQSISTQSDNEWNYVKAAQPLPFISFGSAEVEYQFQFIWQTERHLLQIMLQKGYISLPGWTVRYAQFDGDLANRAEEAIVRIDRNKDILYVQHILPENKPGNKLSASEVTDLASNILQKKYKINHSDLILKSVTPSKKEFRTDWNLEFKVHSDNVLSSGETRVQVVITGNTIELIRKYIHVPEQWQRDSNNDLYYVALLKNISFFVFFFCIMLLLFYIISRTPLASINYRFLIVCCLCTISLSCIHFLNKLPILISTFNTIEPWFLQMWRTIGFFFLSNTMIIGICLLVCNTLCIQWPTACNTQYTTTIWYSGLLKGLIGGLLSILFFSIGLTYINGYSLPPFYEHSILFANSYVPSAFIVYLCVLNFLKYLGMSLLYMYIIRTFGKSKIQYLILLVATTFGVPLYISPASITFLGYLFVTVCCSVFFILFNYLVHTKHSIFNPDKRADIGFVTGIYIASMYNEHIVQMVNKPELIGGILSIAFVIWLSLALCKNTKSISMA